MSAGARWWRTGPQPEYTEKALLAWLRRLAVRLGRVPTAMDAMGRKPSYDQYIGRFGSWPAALTAAGLTLRNKRPNKLTAEQRAEIQRRYIPPSPGNAHELAHEFGVTAARVGQIGRRGRVEE